jgi:glutathione S-transferase
MSDTATFYRCPTPTDWLCPCGKIARALRRHGVDYEQRRVPLRRRDRDGIEALTGQRRVPVVVIDGDVVCDSRRIVENLEYRAAGQSGRFS